MAQFIARERERYRVRALCQALDFSPATFYRSLKEPEAAVDQQLPALEAAFWRHSRRYGSRRLRAELQAEGQPIGRHKVRRLMRAQGLRAIEPRSFVPRTTNCAHSSGYSPSLLLGRPLPPTRPGEIWVADLSYLPLLSGGFAYLATVMDLCSRLILGWQVGTTMAADLVIGALTKALLRRQGKVRGVIAHSDRGRQYAAREYRRLLPQYGSAQSMSRAQETYDNAFAESLFSRYKAELLEGGSFRDAAEATLESFAYIEGYYNRVRRHSGLGYQSPEGFERSYFQRLTEAADFDNEPRKGVDPKQHSCLTS